MWAWAHPLSGVSPGPDPKLQAPPGRPPPLRTAWESARGGEGREVGVDIEHLRPVTDAEQIAQRFFSSRESCQLASFHVDRRNMAFLHIWTQKEAILKATGKGLSFPLDGLTVNADPDLPARVIELGGDEEAAAAWQVTSLRPAAEYLAALASLGDARSICCWGADAGI